MQLQDLYFCFLNEVQRALTGSANSKSQGIHAFVVVAGLEREQEN
jgi:hypothetical protein